MTTYREAPTDPLFATFTPSDEARARSLPTRNEAESILRVTRGLCESSHLVQIASAQHQGLDNKGGDKMMKKYHKYEAYGIKVTPPKTITIPKPINVPL